MRTRAIRTTIAVIGEGPTEKYYLKSLEGIIHAQVKPMIPNHATSMLELEGPNRDNNIRLKTKYHQKPITRKRQGTESLVRFFENERCLEIWFLFHFKYTTQPFNNSNELTKELERICNYEKTEDFLSRKCKGLHHFLLANGGNFDKAIDNSEKSLLSKLKEGREHTYSEMADFFHEVMKN